MKAKLLIPFSVVVCLMVFTAASIQAQTTRHVDDDAPGDPGPGDPSVSDPLEDGSAGHPFDAIQEGIAAAVNGDTVLVADGTYTSDGNRDMDLLGKAITLSSVNGKENCVIDGQASWEDTHYAFMINSGEGPDTVIRGFTITGFMHDWYAAGINCSASPTIEGNLLINNEGFDGGGAIMVAGSPLIIGNVLTGNTAEYCGGIMIWGDSEPLIFNNLLYGNFSYHAGYYDSGAIYCFCWNYGECRPLIIACTIAGNMASGYSGGIYGDENSFVTVRDSIVWGNSNHQIYAYQGNVTWSNVQGWIGGTGNIDADPLFVSGPDGDYYLSQIAAGQAADSPSLDAGSDLAGNICAPLPSGDVCLGDFATRTDLSRDTGQADMGYHYQSTGTVSAALSCVPGAGTLPFITVMTVELGNEYTGITRKIAAKINLKLANGDGYSNWRSGSTNVGPGAAFVASWGQNIPALGSLVGENNFTLVAEDVTPSPFNQAPHPPAGDTDRAACTVTGTAP